MAARPSAAGATMIEDVGHLARGADGLHVWQVAGIRVEETIPTGEITGSGEPVLERFDSIRWPQLQRLIEESRDEGGSHRAGP